MPAFQVNVPHGLGKDQAIERLRLFVQKIAEHYKDHVSQMEGNWAENVLTFALTTYGFAISGTMTVDDSSASIHGHIPFAAVIFKGKIEKSIEDEIRRELS